METLNRHGEPFWEFFDVVTTKAAWMLIVFFVGWTSATAFWQVEHLWNRSNQLTHIQNVVIPEIKGKQAHSMTQSPQQTNGCPPEHAAASE